MKKVKFNGKDEISIISSVGEIRYDAMVMFQQYITAIFQGMDTPLFALTMDRVKSHFNNGDYVQVMSELINFDTAIKFKEYKLDPMGMCFAILITGDETDEDKLKEKLLSLTEKGLTWDVVQTEVFFFMKQVPERFSPYLQAWDMMGKGIEF